MMSTPISSITIAKSAATNMLLVLAAAQLLHCVIAAPLEADDDDDDDRDSADGEWSTTAVQRILHPCGTGQSVAQRMLQQQQQQQQPQQRVAGEVNDSVIGESFGRQHITQTMWATNRMMERLQRHVEDLKTTYANRRHAAFIGIHVEGMPLSTQVDMQLDIGDSVSATVDQLSRVAVLLDLVAVEETQYEPHPLTEIILRLQDHPEHGIFKILCRLHHFWADVSSSTQRDLSVARLASDVYSLLTLSSTGHSSHRHLRTYSILHDLEQLLMRLTMRFNGLIAATIRNSF